MRSRGPAVRRGAMATKTVRGWLCRPLWEALASRVKLSARARGTSCLYRTSWFSTCGAGAG